MAIAGVFFVSTVGWRFLPRKRKAHASPENLFRLDEYVTEVRVPKGSEWVGRRVGDLVSFADSDIGVVAVVRSRTRSLTPSVQTELKVGDILILEGDPAEHSVDR